MAAKVNKANSLIVPLVSYICQSAARKSHDFIEEPLDKKTDFDDSFTNDGKMFDNLGPKGKSICGEIITSFIDEMKSSTPQNGIVYKFLLDLPDRLYPNSELRNLLFRHHRESSDNKYQTLKNAIINKGNEVLSSCYCEESIKNEAIFILVEGLAALFWDLTGNSLLPISSPKQYKMGVFNLALKGVIETNSPIYRYLVNLSDKIKNKPESAGKKGTTKKTEAKAPTLDSAANDDAADLLNCL